MAHIQKKIIPADACTSCAPRGGNVTHYELRWTEVARDADGVPVPTDVARPEGRKRYNRRQETFHAMKAAEARKIELENEQLTTGRVQDRAVSEQPFGVFARVWMDSHAGAVKARTLKEYQRLYACYVAPEFATRAVGSITPADARRFRAELHGRNLAKGTIKHAYDTFRRILDLAVRDGAIASNPAAGVGRLRHNAVGDEDGFTPHPLTSAQVAAVAQHIAVDQEQPVYGLAVEFLAYSGLRAGEFAGLEVGDLTLDPTTARGAVRVVRTKRRTGGAWATGTPKSRKSKRTVPLDGWLVERMAAYLEKHPNRDVPTAALFPNRRKGGAPGPRALDWASPVEPGALYDSLFKKALAAVGLPTSAPATAATPAVRGVRLHDLRHTFAVLSLSAGEHYMQVSQWLGHGNFSITLNVYGGYIPQDEGGKAAPLAAPVAPIAQPAEVPASSNVISLASRRRAVG